MRLRSTLLRLPALVALGVIAVAGLVVSLFSKSADAQKPSTMERLDKAADGANMPEAGCAVDWGKGA